MSCCFAVAAAPSRTYGVSMKPSSSALLPPASYRSLRALAMKRTPRWPTWQPMSGHQHQPLPRSWFAPDKTRLLQQLSQHRQRLHQVVLRRIDDAWMRLDSYSARLRSPAALMERQAERISQLETRLGLWSRRALDRQQRHLTELSLRLQALDRISHFCAAML